MEFKIKESVYKLPIKELELSARSYNVLGRMKCHTIEDVLDKQRELLKQRGCGLNTIKEIKNKILEKNIEYLVEKANAN